MGAEILKRDLKRKKLQTLRFDVDSLVARAAGLSLRLTFVSFIAFHSRIAKGPGHFWVQEMSLFWGRVTWFSIAGERGCPSPLRSLSQKILEPKWLRVSLQALCGIKPSR